jgi:putative PIN family toxin of toxin-antitoxin system
MSTVKTGRLRVVLDSNVYISAFTHPHGQPFQIWRKALQGDYALLVSPSIVAEVAGVLRLKFDWDDARTIRRIKLLAKAAQIVIPKITLQVIADDETDNRILECAVAGKADLIVSGDHHLRRLKSFEGIGIVRPIDFLRTIG